MEINKLKLPKEVDKRRYLRQAESELLQKKSELQLELNTITEKLEKIQNKLSIDIPNSLEITLHAIKRFKERIKNTHTRNIIRILSDKILFERYLKFGAGKYRLGRDPHIVAVVSNFKVVTVYNNFFDLKGKMEFLEHYMDYWIDQRILQELSNNENEPILSSSQYKKVYYKAD